MDGTYAMLHGVGVFRCQVLPLLLGLAATPASLHASEAKTPLGKLAPKVLVASAAREDCRLIATRTDPGLKGAKPFEGAAPLELPPGRYWVRVSCGPSWVSAISKVEIRAGQVASPKLSLERARIRVMAERNGQRIPAELRIYREGAASDEEPLYIAAANSRAELATGRYDLIVRAKSEDGVTIEAELRGAKLGKDKLAAYTADLSNGSLEVGATENGRAVEGLVEIFRRDGPGSEVARGDTGQVFELTPGRYWVDTTLGSTANFATQRSEVWVRSKKRSTVRERFATGRVRVEARRDGKPVAGVVELGLPSAGEYFNYFEAPGEAILSPGEYRIHVKAKIDAPVTTREMVVKVKQNATLRLSFDFTPAKLVVDVLRAGRKIEVESIEVRPAGGGEKVGQPNFDGEYVLWPGHYEVVARLANGDEARDGPFEVSFGQSLVRRVEVSHGTLSLTARRGKSVASTVKIAVFKPGAPKPLAELVGQGTATLSPGTYDVRITDGPTTTWRQGIKVHERKSTELVLVLGETEAKETELPDGELGEGELPEGE